MYKILVLYSLCFTISRCRLALSATERQLGPSKTNDSLELDLFKLNDHEISRRSDVQIWNWDLWCQMQPIFGKCDKKLNRFFYNSELDQCETFIYSGCGGNKNLFEAKLACERHCKGVAYMKVGTNVTINPCKMQRNPGLCMAFIPKYYFDMGDMKCKEFTYGGCGGNQNRYNSLEECEMECKPRPVGRNGKGKKSK